MRGVEKAFRSITGRKKAFGLEKTVPEQFFSSKWSRIKSFENGLGKANLEGYQVCYMIEGSLEVKVPTIWTDGKAGVGRVREEKGRRKNIRKEKESEEGRCRARKGRNVANLCFSNVCGPGESKSRLAKAAGAEPYGEMRDEKLDAVVAHISIRNVKSASCSKTFGSFKCKMHKAPRVWSAFGS